MPASIGVNLRVTGHCKQGGRKYMEDYFSVAYQQTEDEKDLEYAFFGIFDGHGGSEAATFAKEHLMEFIVRQRQFWSDRDEDVLKAIREGFIATHLAMWKEQEKWPRTASGLPSTAGTTASIAFIRRGRIFTGHVGDSGIILGYQANGSNTWEARRLTKDHKPESRAELARIEQSGGKVVSKSGVPRVVWYRPQIGHKGPITRSTPFDEIPFLAVARSLGDLWSYNSANNEFVVSPEPDTNVIPIDTDTFRCLIFGTDGLWNMISPSAAVGIVQAAEQHNAMIVLSDNPRAKSWINPSMNLVERALDRWSSTRLRADNTSVVTLMLDPPGPPRAQVIRNAQRLLSEQQRQQHHPQSQHRLQQETAQMRNVHFQQDHQQQKYVEQTSAEQQRPAVRASADHQYPATGLHILTRYERAPPAPSDERPPAPARYTEEYLDELHRQLYGSMLGGAAPADSTDPTRERRRLSPSPAPPPMPPPSNASSDKPSCSSSVPNVDDVASRETIQINVVSSSSDSKKTLASSEAVPKKSPGRRPRAGREVEVEDRPSMPCTRSHSSRSYVCTRARTSAAKALHPSDSLSPDKKSLTPLKHRSRSLGSTVASTRIMTRGRKTPENSSPIASRTNLAELCKSTTDSDKPKTRLRGRPPKRDLLRKNDEEKAALLLKRSRSLGPRDLLVDAPGTPPRAKLRGRPIKRERPGGEDEENGTLNAPKLKRSRSLGPHDLSTDDAIKPPATPKARLQGRPTKRERPEGGDEENAALSAPQLKRSRSLGPRDLVRRDIDRNLRERNTLSDVRSKGSPPVTRSHRTHRLPN